MTVTVGQQTATGEVPVVGWAAVQNAGGDQSGDPREHFSGSVLVDATGSIDKPLDDQLFPFNPMVYQEDAHCGMGNHSERYRVCFSIEAVGGVV